MQRSENLSFMQLNYKRIFHFRSLNVIATYKTEFVYEKVNSKQGSDGQADGETDTGTERHDVTLETIPIIIIMMGAQ